LRIIAPHPVDKFVLPYHDCAGPRQVALEHDPVWIMLIIACFDA
jgi:hypothetical protein